MLEYKFFVVGGYLSESRLQRERKKLNTISEYNIYVDGDEFKHIEGIYLEASKFLEAKIKISTLKKRRKV